MSKYDIFARYYDLLTRNVDYSGRAEYLLELMKRFGHSAGITLDLACGTGSLTLELFRRGIDVYGADASSAMLTEARGKCCEAGADILFLCQKMQDLDLYGTVDTVVCALDSINHLENSEQIQRAFDRVSLFLNPGGLFLFDCNTVYKHRNILRDRVFVYDMEEVYCVWQNSFRGQGENRVAITLDFFEKAGKSYLRSRESFSEIALETETLSEMLCKAGFSVAGIFEDLSFETPKKDSQRIVFAARKEPFDVSAAKP